MAIDRMGKRSLRRAGEELLEEEGEEEGMMRINNESGSKGR